MAKVKHVRTADCVLAGYRVHKSGPDAIGSLLLGLYDDGGAPAPQWGDAFGGLLPVGVVGAFPMARRRELLAELQPLVARSRSHPWALARPRRPSGPPRHGSRWNPDKELSFVPLRPERVVEVRYDHMEGARFRHRRSSCAGGPTATPRRAATPSSSSQPVRARGRARRARRQLSRRPAISSPIASEEVAAGEGALRTCSARRSPRRRSRRRGCRRGRRACARTPARPASTSSARSSGT